MAIDLDLDLYLDLDLKEKRKRLYVRAMYVLGATRVRSLRLRNLH